MGGIWRQVLRQSVVQILGTIIIGVGEEGFHNERAIFKLGVDKGGVELDEGGGEEVGV